jgi:hypothetical protein
MRVKKRVKRGVKKGIKRVKSAPPEAYLAGSGVLVGGAAVLLLATTKRGQELLKRTVQLALGPEADERESQESDVPEEDDEQESQESDVREDVHDEPADADVEEEPAVDADGDEKSKVTDLKPRDQRPRSVAPGGPPRSSRTAPAPAEANAKGSYVAKPQWLSGCLFDDNSAGMLIMAGGNGKPLRHGQESRLGQLLILEGWLS